jgi:hypothetical protein
MSEQETIVKLRDQIDRLTSYINDVVLSDETTPYFKQLGLALMVSIGHVPSDVEAVVKDDLEITSNNISKPVFDVNNSVLFYLPDREYDEIRKILYEPGYITSGTPKIQAIKQLRLIVPKVNDPKYGPVSVLGLREAKDIVDNPRNFQ